MLARKAQNKHRSTEWSWGISKDHGNPGYTPTPSAHKQREITWLDVANFSYCTACQAPNNWTEVESDSFFTRHFYRAVLQKIFLDKGVITKVYHSETDCGDGVGARRNDKESPFNMSTNPVIIGSLGKSCFKSFHAYVRGAIKKLASNQDTNEKYSAVIHEKMGDMTDDEIDAYAKAYAPRKRELSSIWTLMAFSAGVVESLIVTDRWLFLKEHGDVVQDCWVESVFDYKESPRNLVVVGIKKNKAAAGG